jgi:hypothetical protein
MLRAPPPDVSEPRGAVKSVISVMREQGVQRGILVVEKPLMGHAQQTIDMETEQRKLNNEEWRIEVFLAGKLLIHYLKAL